MFPTDLSKQEIYSFYKLIYSSNFTFSKKVTLMTQALGMEEWSWRVVGISENAVVEIANNNFNRPTNKLERDHQSSRAGTCRQIFAETLYSFEDWWNLVWENDKTLLVTKEEHKKKNFSKIYEIDFSLGYFRDAGKISYKFTKSREGEFIKQLIQKHSIQIRPTST